MAELFLDFVEGGIFSVLHLFTDGNTVLVYHDEDLFRLGHLQTHYLHHLPEDLLVNLVQSRTLGTVAQSAKGRLSLPALLEHMGDVIVEEVDGDLEHLVFFYFHHHEQVLESVVADPDCMFVTCNCSLQPLVLILEELGIEVGDAPG